MKKKVVILTGAGMSSESGISTFRDSNGLWNNYQIEDVATPEAFVKNPELVMEFYNHRRRELLKVKPNAGHYGLVELEKNFEVYIITQNVDNLHERAGSSNVLHLHGELMKACSVKNTSKIFEISPNKPDLHVGDMDSEGNQLRPFIVWFGEPVPLIDRAIEIVQTGDIFVVIGTSLNVYPAAGLLNYATTGKPIFLIDPKNVSTNRHDIHIIQEVATKGISILIKKLSDYI